MVAGVGVGLWFPHSPFTNMKIEFTPPKDFIVPEGTQPGQDFDLVCTFRVNGNKVCLVQMGEAKLEGYRQDSRPDYKQYAEGMTEDMK